MNRKKDEKTEEKHLPGQFDFLEGLFRSKRRQKKEISGSTTVLDDSSDLFGSPEEEEEAELPAVGGPYYSIEDGFRCRRFGG